MSNGNGPMAAMMCHGPPTLLNISYPPQPQYVHGTPLNMLDTCRMNNALSPTTPANIPQPDSLSPRQFMGGWDHPGEEGGQGVKQMEQMMDLFPTTTIHHTNNRDCHQQFHPSSQYLTNLPLGESPFPPHSSDPHSMLDFSGQDQPFHKGPDPPPPHHHHPTSYTDNYDFISDFPLNGGGVGPPCSLLGVQCSPGCMCQFTSHHPSNHAPLGALLPPLSNSSHPDYWPDDLNCDPGEYGILSKGDSPTTSDCITDIDSEMDSKSSGGSLSHADICQVSPPKRKVGRPPKKDKKIKRNEKKTGRLWEFIRDLLKNPEYCPSLVRWENPEEGHFRFVNSEKVAQLWGQIKGNPRMTYEKLSRAMRYYYKSHVFEPVLGRRLVYKFGYNATNWKPSNPNFASIQKLYSN